MNSPQNRFITSMLSPYFALYKFLGNSKRKFIQLIDNLRINRYCMVFRKNKYIFKILDMGLITRYRANTFESKEPETISWIESFEKHDSLLDIGANVGLYSLFAAKLGKNVVSIEPDALNYALLNINIRENNLSNYITPYSIAIHNTNKFSSFNISSYAWGGALNSFDNCKDFRGNSFRPVHYQGVYGISLDDFLDHIGFEPTHIKIDVDGNEILILQGASRSLASPRLKSLLVELDESREDYSKSLQIILNAGFNLIDKVYASSHGIFSNTANHIFKRK